MLEILTIKVLNQLKKVELIEWAIILIALATLIVVAHQSNTKAKPFNQLAAEQDYRSQAGCNY